jgi:uncharacterized phage protein gp47/JayE
MPLKIPSRADTVSALQAFVKINLPELDPTLTRRRGFIGGMVKSLGSAMHDWYVMLKKYADNEPFPQTASESFFPAGWWIDITQLPRNPPTPAQGFVIITGTDGAILPSNTELSLNGNTYTTDTAVTVTAQSLVGTSSSNGSFVGRFTTVQPHNLATGMLLNFSGCVDESLNGSFQITVIDAHTIEYDLEFAVSGTPLEPNPVASGSWTNVRITCTEDGIKGNIDAGSSLDITNVHENIEGTALITFDGIADGAELETLEIWRKRVLEALGTDFGTFTAPEIRIVAKKVPGVTRVFVREPKRRVYDDKGVQILDGVGADGYPTEGRVRISFLRENDADPIPSALEVEQVRQKIHSELLTAHTLKADAEILAPERHNLEVRFRSISPDTPGMRASIRANLTQFLIENASWGGNLEIEGIRCAIRQAYDGETGQSLKTYDLDSPTLDITLPVDAYPVLAGVTWGTGV